MHAYKKIISPYVLQSRLSDLETSIRVADNALFYYKNLQRDFPNVLHPGACVGLALYKENQATEERLQRLANMSGLRLDGFMSKISNIRQLLNVEFNLTFEQISLMANIPIRYAHTASKIFEDIKNEFPNDQTLNRAALVAAILLVVAVKRGMNKIAVLENLTKITVTNQQDVLSVEAIVRATIGNRYGKCRQAPIHPHTSTQSIDPQLKQSIQAEVEQLQSKPMKKQKQMMLDFAIIPKKQEIKA
ncbi:hypothetical protein GPJ56_008876 [Histomonas meleagridis]|uniref:uncharacterized protein n=1 Tax=Histomonas meleagridis TaxID=135588 RepID=UPI00355AC80F|nr:hypothetical protein GPJ56_008876 [Histomonas meleagridis]KAH0797802.1 hypothetical protein GO595_009431 [Histomonas meleagridis]